MFGCTLLRLVVASCVDSPKWRPLSNEDFAVYGSILRQFEPSGGREDSTPFALLDSTSSRTPMTPGIRPTDPALWGNVLGQSEALEEAVADFQVQRRHDCKLEQSDFAGVEYTLHGLSEIYRRADADSTLRGVFFFSRIGFTRDRQHAFLYVRHYVGTLSSTSCFYLLSLRDGHWQVDFNPGGMGIS